jgi:hypothetical protein
MDVATRKLRLGAAQWLVEPIRVEGLQRLLKRACLGAHDGAALVIPTNVEVLAKLVARGRDDASLFEPDEGRRAERVRKLAEIGSCHGIVCACMSALLLPNLVVEGPLRDAELGSGHSDELDRFIGVPVSCPGGICTGQ